MQMSWCSGPLFRRGRSFKSWQKQNVKLSPTCDYELDKLKRSTSHVQFLTTTLLFMIILVAPVKTFHNAWKARRIADKQCFDRWYWCRFKNQLLQKSSVELTLLYEALQRKTIGTNIGLLAYLQQDNSNGVLLFLTVSMLIGQRASQMGGISP